MYRVNATEAATIVGDPVYLSTVIAGHRDCIIVIKE
jgi:hypothetical protein